MRSCKIRDKVKLSQKCANNNALLGTEHDLLFE